MRPVELLLVLVGGLLLLLLYTRDQVTGGGNEASRLALVESLVERSTSSIDGSSFSWTGDKIRVGDRYFSNKPPLLALLAALPYAGLHRLGYSFAGGEGVYPLTLLVVGLPALLAVGLLYRRLRREHGARYSLLLASSLLWATQYGVYSGTINSHTVAGTLVLAVILLFAEPRSLVGGRFWALQGCLWLLCGIEPVHGGLLLALIGLAFLLQQDHRALLLHGVSAVLLTGLLCGLNTWHHGHLLFPTMVPGAYDYPGSAANPSFAALGFRDWYPRYLFQVLLGHHGLFLYSPILVLGLLGLLGGVRSGDAADRRPAILAVGLVVGSVAFHSLFAGAYGGWNYGFRYFVPLVPILLLRAGAAVFRRPCKPLLYVLLFSGVPITLVGVYHPWPPTAMGSAYRGPEEVNTWPLLGNAVAMLRDYGHPCPRLEAEVFGEDRGAVHAFYHRFFASLGRTAEAETHRERALTLRLERGWSVTTARELASLRYRKQDYTSIEALLEPVRASGSATLEDLLLLGSAALALGDGARALGIFGEALRLSPQDPWLRHNVEVLRRECAAEDPPRRKEGTGEERTP